VRFEGRGMGLAAAVHIGRHVHPKAKPEAAPPPVPTGIDYLSLIAARRDAELARPISFAELSAATANSDIGTAVDDHTEEHGS
jgi:putative transposase